MKRAAVTIPLILLALAGCAAAPTPTGGPTGPDIQPTPLPSQTTISPTEPALAGDCTATDGLQPSIPVIYTVFTGDATPVEVTYMAFNLDGTTPTVTETVSGPVWSKVGYACTDAAGSQIWTLTAAQTTTGAVGCTLAFGGQLVKTDSGYAESATPVATSADCSGNPGM